MYLIQRIENGVVVLERSFQTKAAEMCIRDSILIGIGDIPRPGIILIYCV